MMSRKRNRYEGYPNDWDVEYETQDSNAIPPIAFVPEMQDPNVNEQNTDNEASIDFKLGRDSL
jgi:hypothetical protein